MTRCGSTAYGGGQCELDVHGDDVLHEKTSWPFGKNASPFTFRWTDESQRRLAEKESGRD